MKADIITLFPDMVATVAATSMLGRAQEAALLDLSVTDLREFGLGRYRRVDDSPYGGGPGMVFRPEPVYAAVEAATNRAGAPCRLLMPSPQGRVFDQPMAEELAAEARPLVFLCGHYEGVDQRILDGLGFEEVSVGDYVLTGGELPALIMLDAAARLIPGVLGNDASPEEDCFSAAADGILKFPQYTRPAEFRGMGVPQILLSGHHREIEAWRREQALAATRTKRPDLLVDGAGGEEG